MNTNNLTGMDTTGLPVDPVKEDAERGEVILDALLGPSLRPRKLRRVTGTTPSVKPSKISGSFALGSDMNPINWMDRLGLSVEDVQRDADGMAALWREFHGLPPSERPDPDEFKKQFLCEWSREPMNLASPYGEGNHHRISWRRSWDVDREALTATHRPSGFVLAFTPCPDGGYTARPGCEIPPFGPDGGKAMAQMFGLRELLKDGWEIFHTVVAKNSR